MRQLADYVLSAGGKAIPVSAPVRGDLRSSSSRSRQGRYVTLGFAAQDATTARGLVGHEARMLSNIQIPGRELARLRILEMHASMALLVAEILPGAVEEAISPGDAVASPPGTATAHA
ncbi:MAG TPA: hypothetical protein VFD38_10280 [Myxococcaceae bacterium]|nr:hypothetical protein [Myxococcaceae bacterium]